LGGKKEKRGPPARGKKDSSVGLIVKDGNNTVPVVKRTLLLRGESSRGGDQQIRPGRAKEMGIRSPLDQKAAAGWEDVILGGVQMNGAF